MGFASAIHAGIEGFMVFRGRASRAEFWFFVLFALMFVFAATFLEAMLETNMVSVFVNVAFFMPLLSVSVRRLHDTNRSAVYLAILLLPLPFWLLSDYIGPVWAAVQLFAVVLLALILCLPGQQGANRFGPDPAEKPDLEAF